MPFITVGAAWEKLIPALMSAGYRTITYDRRGFGRSSQPAVGYDYDTFRGRPGHDRQAARSARRGAHRPLHGHREITRYLSTYGSSRVSKAVLMSPIPPFLLKRPANPDGVDGSVFDGFMNKILVDRFAYQTAFLNDFFNYEQTKGKQVSEDAFRANWNWAVMASPIGTYACVKAWQTDFRPDLSQVDVPVLIIQGDADRVLPYPVTGAKLQPALPGSQLVTVPGAPHAIPWTHADDVNPGGDGLHRRGYAGHGRGCSASSAVPPSGISMVLTVTPAKASGLDYHQTAGHVLSDACGRGRRPPARRRRRLGRPSSGWRRGCSGSWR